MIITPMEDDPSRQDYPEYIREIGDQIANLTLAEYHLLVNYLNQTYGICLG